MTDIHTLCERTSTTDNTYGSILPSVSIPPFLGLPSGVIRRNIEVRGGSVASLVTEVDDPVERVLFIPGYTGSKEDFLALLPYLKSAGIHAVAIDQFGQHESRIEADESRFSLDELAADVCAVAHHIWPDGPRPHLVGHSLGGVVSRAAVLREPGLFASLTLLASGPHAVGEHQHPALLGIRTLLPDTDLATVWEIKRALEEQAGGVVPPPTIAEFLERRWLNNHPHALRAMAEILLSEPNRVSQLAATGIPTAVVCGADDDVWWPEQQREMSNQLGGDFIVIRDVGHSPAADAPEPTVSALAGFWQATAALDHNLRSATQLRTASARQARIFARETVQAWELPEAIIDDVELVASELATNAFEHAEGPVQIGVEERPDNIRVWVTDCTSAPPVMQNVPAGKESGRGMQIVASLCHDWGTHAEPRGKTVWADVAMPPR
jgi:pimeloyl-ACP methyl ester carboxylesterase